MPDRGTPIPPPDPLCADCGHVRSMHVNGTDECLVGHRGNLGTVEPCTCSGFVEDTYVASPGELPKSYSEADCVDELIEVEMESGSGLPFATLLRLKKESDGRAWVSPEVSLRMMAYVEQAAVGSRARLDGRVKAEREMDDHLSQHRLLGE